MREPCVMSTVKDEGGDSTVPIQCLAGNNSYRKRAEHSPPATEARPPSQQAPEKLPTPLPHSAGVIGMLHHAQLFDVLDPTSGSQLSHLSPQPLNLSSVT